MAFNQIAWGDRVSPKFRSRAIEICSDLGVNPDYLMACMAFESGLTFSPRIKNAAGSGAIGLIQFMPQTAMLLGTSTEELAAMSAEEQLEFVYKYFKPFKGRLKSLSDVYMAILWPSAVGKPESYVLFHRDDPRRPKRYIQNSGLDFNKDGNITKLEAVNKIKGVLSLGLVS